MVVFYGFFWYKIYSCLFLDPLHWIFSPFSFLNLLDNSPFSLDSLIICIFLFGNVKSSIFIYWLLSPWYFLILGQLPLLVFLTPSSIYLFIFSPGSLLDFNHTSSLMNDFLSKMRSSHPHVKIRSHHFTMHLLLLLKLRAKVMLMVLHSWMVRLLLMCWILPPIMLWQSNY